MGKLHDRMDRELRIRGYAENTRKSYIGNMRCFVRFFMRPPDELTTEDVKQYQLFLTKDKRVSWSTFNVHVCAIRFFYREVLRVEWDVEQIPYQRSGRRLLVVLSCEEVRALLDTTTNLKHRALLMILYSAGLRPSEAVHLQLADIDSGRMMIRVDQGKGRKDRYVMLSDKLLVTLRRYWREYRPALWLFPGQDPSCPLTRGSLEKLFTRAKKKAGIQKPVTPHSTGANSSTRCATACSGTSTATVCSNATSPMTCSPGRRPAGSASMPRSTSRPVTVPGSNDSCVTVPVFPSPSNGSRLPGTVRLEASASSIVFPIPHRMVPRLSRSLLSSSSSGSRCSFTHHASIATAITGCWLPMPSSGIRSSRSGMSRVV